MNNNKVVAIDAYNMVYRRDSISIYINELAKSFSVNPNIRKIYLLVPFKPDSTFLFKELFELEKIVFVSPKKKYDPMEHTKRLFLWIQVGIRQIIQSLQDNVDFLISPYHQTCMLLDKRIKVVTVIHDICGINPQLVSRSKRSFYRHYLNFITSIIRADLLIPISEFTKKQYSQRFPSATSRLTKVVYNNISSALIADHTVHQVLSTFNLSHNLYFMAIGAIGPRKGFDLMIEAYKAFKKNGGKSHFVLVVSKQSVKDIQKTVDENKLFDVHIIHSISNLERDALYKGATALLFPSRCEGFGYPILEAMVQGCPPIAWNNGPAVEILNSRDLLLPNLDISEIERFMMKYENLNNSDRNYLAQNLMDRAKTFMNFDFGQKFYEAMLTSTHDNKSFVEEV